jgi:hypothetical protein
MVYDDARHEYSDDGVIIPSVTQVLYPASSGPWFNKASSDRGHEAHKGCAKFALDPAAGFPDQMYVDSFALWCYKRDPKWVAIEEMIDGKVDGYRYAGRFDGLAIIGGILTLIDWKSGVKSSKFRAQLGGYALVAKPARAMILYLRKDMTFEESWLTASDLALGIQEFRAAIRIFYAKAN